MSKFRTWDSKILAEAVKVTVQIRAKIEELCISTRTTPEDLPSSLIPTEDLYKIVCAYEAAYESLLEYDLVKTGNLKTQRNIH